ncbi:MAG: hypothetical protein ACI4WH_05965 [Oscillospiraceae bacterium]
MLSNSVNLDSSTNSISRTFQQNGTIGTINEYTIICTYNGNSTSITIKVSLMLHYCNVFPYTK